MENTVSVDRLIIEPAKLKMRDRYRRCLVAGF